MADDESYIVKPRDLDLILRGENEQELRGLMDDPLSVVSGIVNDYLEQGPKMFAGSTVRVAHAVLKGKLLQQVAQEINEFRKKGKIADDFAGRKYGYDTWVDLLKIIDEETPDEDRLEALKAMFYAANKVNATDAQQVVAYQLFQIAKKLSSNDLLVLKATFDANFQGGFTGNSYKDWSDRVSKSAGGLPNGLVDLADSTLVQYRLLTERYGTGTPANPLISSPNMRLTDLGLKFCQNIRDYKSNKES